MMKIRGWIAFILLQMPIAVAAEQALDEVVVIALSPLDKSAVVRLPDRSMQVLKPGDVIDGTRLKLTQVLTDKLVLELDRNRIVWLRRAVNGVSEVVYPEMPQ